MIDMNNEKIIRGHLEGFMPVKISCYKCGDYNKVMEQKTYRTSAKRDLYTHSLRSGFKMTENGRSMIEMLGVLAIIGVLSVGGIAGYSKAMMKFKINKTLQQIATIMTNSATLYVNKPENYDCYYYSNQDSADPCHIADLVIPDDMKKCDGDDCKYYNVFGGEVFLGNCYYDAPCYYFYMRELPTEACIALATQNYGDKTQGVLSVGINVEGETDFTSDSYLDGYNDRDSDFLAYTHGPYYPIPIAKATEKCAMCGEDSSCDVIITMY